MAVIRNSEFSCFYPSWAGLGAAFRHVATPDHSSHQHCHLHTLHCPAMLSNIFLYVSKYFCTYLNVCILACKSSVLLITGRGGCCYWGEQFVTQRGDCSITISRHNKINIQQQYQIFSLHGCWNIGILDITKALYPSYN